MAGPAEPFGKGVLLLVFAGLSTVIIGAWLVLRTPAGPADPPVDFPGVAPPPATERPQPQAPEQPIAVSLASADAARGERFFRARCAACHTIEAGGPDGIGPNLHGVIGAPVAARPGYAASDALRRQGGRWDWDKASRFLRSPRGFAPGTRMAFAGVTDAQDRADLLLYMNEQGGSLPAPAGAR